MDHSWGIIELEHIHVTLSLKTDSLNFYSSTMLVIAKIKNKNKTRQTKKPKS